MKGSTVVEGIERKCSAFFLLSKEKFSMK